MLRRCCVLIVENETHCDFVKLREMMIRLALSILYYLIIRNIATIVVPDVC